MSPEEVESTESPATEAARFERFVELQKASGGLGNPRNKRGFVSFEGKTEAAIREICFCAFYTKHTRAYHAQGEKARAARMRARRRAEKAKKRAAWKAYRARERQPVRWNRKNRERRAAWLLFAARVVGWLAVEKLRCNPCPLSFQRGIEGQVERKVWKKNLVERAVEAVTEGTRTATRAMQRRLRDAWHRDGRRALRELSAKGISFKGANVCHPFTRDMSALVEGRLSSTSSPHTNGHIPQAGREEGSKREGRRGTPLGKRLWHLAAQGATAAQRAWGAARAEGAETHLMPYRPSYAIRWFHRALTFGYDLRDAVALHTSPRGVAIIREWCAKASGAGASGKKPWTPGGMYKALSGALGEAAAPFWGDKSPAALAKRREARRDGAAWRAGLREQNLNAARAALGLNQILDRVFA